MRLILSAFFMLLMFGGCVSQRSIVMPLKDLPSWYTNPNRTTDQTLYAVGEGVDKNDAIANALNTMVSTLGVYISSELNTKSVARGGDIDSYDSTTTNEINSKVLNIRISNYKIIHSLDYGFERYLVAIEADKAKLYYSLKKELEQKFKTVQNNEKISANYNAIGQLANHEENKTLTKNVRNILMVMHSLNPAFDDSLYMSKLHKIENDYEELLSKITFSLASNRDAKFLKPAILDGLNSRDYRVTTKGGKNHFNIFIASKTSRGNPYGIKLVKSSILITVKDNAGDIVGSKSFEITGQSSQGYTAAKQNVVKKLNTMVKQEHISSIIGLDI